MGVCHISTMSLARALRSIVPAFCGRNMSMFATTRVGASAFPAAIVPRMLPARFTFCTEVSSDAEAPTEVKLYVGNLPWDIDDDALNEMFTAHSPLGCNVVRKSEDGLSRGFGFVSFANQELADSAKEAVNGLEVLGRQITVNEKTDTPARPRGESYKGDDARKLYFGNLSWEMDGSRLEELCASLGQVTTARIIMDRTSGLSRGFGFVTMGSEEEAQAVISELNGAEQDGRTLTVNVATGGKPGLTRGATSHMASSDKKVYVGNLSWGMEEADLMELCSKFGDVTATRIVTDRDSGLSRGFGFVTMGTEEAATEVIGALNQTDVDGRVLTVGIAGAPKERY